MANESGTPPKGESASTDVVPLSHPVEASELDDGWVDVPIEASPSPDLPVAGSTVPIPSILPQSLSPVVLAASEAKSAAPPAQAAEPSVKAVDVAEKKPPAEAKPVEAKPAETKPNSQVAHSDRHLGRKLKSGYVLVPVAALAAGIALIFLRPKEIAPEKPVPARAPAAAAQVPVQAENQPLVLPPKAEEPAAPPANAEPVDSAAAAASAGPLPSASAASGDTFVDAFHKNAAKSDSKWAGVKREPSKSESGKAGAAKPAAPAPAAPAQVDPLDVLKRLEEARKNKK
jgi:DnaK suppressor protein